MPRAILNLVEFEHMFVLYYMAYFKPKDPDQVSNYVSSADVSCFYPPLWFVVFTNISSFFMTLNASLGFFIYCVGCRLFRAELKLRFEQLKGKLVEWQGRLVSCTVGSRMQPEAIPALNV
jgi:hypothetical protein